MRATGLDSLLYPGDAFRPWRQRLAGIALDAGAVADPAGAGAALAATVTVAVLAVQGAVTGAAVGTSVG